MSVKKTDLDRAIDRYNDMIAAEKAEIQKHEATIDNFEKAKVVLEAVRRDRAQKRAKAAAKKNPQAKAKRVRGNGKAPDAVKMQGSIGEALAAVVEDEGLPQGLADLRES